MEPESTHTWVEKFLDGELEGDALRQFQEQLANDPELQQALELAEKTREALALHARMELKEKIRAIDKSISKPMFLKPVFYWSVAASVLIIAVGGVLIYANARFSDSAIYQAYYSAAGDEYTTMGGDEGSFQKGINAYNQQLYDDALTFFNLVEKTDTFYTRSQLFTAIIKMEKGDYNNAIELLTNVTDPTLQNEIYWYSGLCYIQLGQPEKARTELQKLKGTSYREKDVKELLKELDSPLRKLVF